jgi:cobalt/nickel transport system permease protein
LRHARIERWSLGKSAIHRRHAAAKILAVLALLISIATLQRDAEIACVLYLVLLLAAAAVARLPISSMLWMAAAVLPFAMCFAAVSALAGEPARAVWLVIRAYLSSFAALLLIATTPMPGLIAGLESLRAPRFLLQVMQFLYRYLIVLMEEANAMRQAGSARAGSVGTLQFRQAAAAAGVLFARSYARAQAIHRAMLARGFEGRLPVFTRMPFRIADAGFLAATAALSVAIRAV